MEAYSSRKEKIDPTGDDDITENDAMKKTEDEDDDKLTEYEIFQKLQMKEQKADRKRVSNSQKQIFNHYDFLG